MTNSQGETVQILDKSSLAITPGASWSPAVGEELLRFLDTVHSDSREKTRTESCEILARGTAPRELGQAAGLVVGYVQSGKTTSFTAATALARDNGFALVIVIAGTSTNLLEQTQERLISDLGLDDRAAYQRWVHAKSPKVDSDEASKVESALEDWLDPGYESDQTATVLVTVMKQHRHLEWLVEVLQDIATRVDFSRITALIIDDEADQASPNLKRKAGEESATYGRIRKVRSTLPSHTLLEYTATPQATLLVSLIDEISPDYVCVIDPGAEYTGGRYFFQDNHERFVKHIPASDVEVMDDEAEGPPLSLLRAYASFILGCAAGRALRSGPSQRSMLVHPSQKTLPQARFVGWLRGVRDLWAELLRAGITDLTRTELVETLLRPAYADLAETVPDLPPIEELLDRLPGVLKKSSIIELNASKGRPQPIEWSSGYSWVLVGGQLLDRGFTVEGLTVTYMPRGLGVGNADTVQQRARFFGYKRSYAGYCRAWLDPEVDAAFTLYVDHEEAMRAQLVRVAREGTSLKDWKRVFLLDRSMRLTRASVIRLDTTREMFAKKWFAQRHFEDADDAIFRENRLTVDRFVSAYEFSDDPGDDRRDPLTQVHPFVDLRLSSVLEELLEDFVMTDEDAVQFAALRVLLAVAEDKQSESCRVHLMMGKSPLTRLRSLDERGRIKNLFQGSNAASGYSGDRAVCLPDEITVQIHRIELHGDDGTEEGATAKALAENVPVLAVHIPARFTNSVIVQTS